MKTLFKLTIGVFAILIAVAGCKKEIPDPVEIPEANDVNKFIYNGLGTYYYWVSQIPALTNPKYEVRDSLNAFLNQYEDPEELFEDLLYQPNTVDKWSIIVDDSKEIDDWLAGISESMGFDIKLYLISSGSEDLVGVIRYVYKNSPAEKAGLKRGDFFTHINNQHLTISNYSTLLFTQKSYEMGMASYSGAGFNRNGKNINLTAVILQENPIHLDTILNVNGLKVGYLVYNSFSNSYDSLLNTNYDIELNKVFGRFKDEGIGKLIVDFRYNSGGYISSAVYLASMIFGTNTQQIFAKSQYNSALEQYYTERYGSSYFNIHFESSIEKTDKTPQTPIQSLGLNEVYIITSGETASAPELVINGLKSYMTVKQVGQNTMGKNVGSFTIRDWDDNGNVNPTHKWAMQPIVLKVANSQGFSDYSAGLAPLISKTESPVSLLPLGNPEEVLLKACLDDIRGMKSAQVAGKEILRPFKSSKDLSPFSGMMVLDKLPFPLHQAD